MKKLLITCGFIGLLLGVGHGTAYAHQPNVIGKDSNVTVPDPEVSKAYYAELSGSPAVYVISSDMPFELYANILVPDILGATRDYSAVIKDKNGKEIAKLGGESSEWERWYEEFAGDWYWKGSEFKQEVPAGTYTITVSNPSNTGKYVLAPGEKEIFTIAGTPHTIREVFLMKTQFFAKPWYSIYQGIIGKFLLGATILLIGLLSLTVYLFIGRRRKSSVSKP